MDASHLIDRIQTLTGSDDRAETERLARVERVAAREAVAPGFAREHAQSVCRALGETLDDEDLRHLATRLPEQIAPLLAAADPEPRPAPATRAPRGSRRTLSEGRPHSDKPLSAAAPRSAQQESLARSDNPHGETKLSSAHGTTQEREAETLAGGKRKR